MTSANAIRRWGGIFDADKQRSRLIELENIMAGPTFWADQNNARVVLDEATSIRRKLDTLADLGRKLSDAQVLIELGETEPEITREVNAAESQLDQFELENLLGGAHDKSNGILSIHAGAGGTESCDWAEMLLRMYRRWCDARGFKNEIVDIQPGDEAGIKSVTMLVTGDYAYGYLKAERGVHRLVRISPFDSNKRRHTSFASVDVIAELAETDEVELKMEDVQIDTFRSGGKRRPERQQGRDGGAHDASADRHRRAMPERAQPAPEPRTGVEDVEGAPV